MYWLQLSHLSELRYVSMRYVKRQNFDLSAYLDSNLSQLSFKESNVFIEYVLLQLDVGGALLKQDFHFRYDLVGWPEVVAPVEIGQLAVATGQLITAFAEEKHLLRLKKSLIVNCHCWCHDIQ